MLLFLRKISIYFSNISHKFPVFKKRKWILLTYSLNCLVLGFLSNFEFRLPTMASMGIPHHATNVRTSPPHTVSRAPADRLQYWYIDDRGHEVHSKDAAAVLIDGEI